MGAFAQACPGCGKRLEDSQVVCLSCGYHMVRDKQLGTQVHKLKERALVKRAKRRAASIGAKSVPWLVGLGQTGVLVLVAAIGRSTPEAADSALLVLRSYAVIGGLVILAYAVREAGLWALLTNAVVWWVLLADDADPFMVGIFANILLTPVLMMVAATGAGL